MGFHDEAQSISSEPQDFRLKLAGFVDKPHMLRLYGQRFRG
jgi:hypothetical protein